MREDMYKVILERPRRTKDNALKAARLRDDRDGPMRLGMRAGYGRPDLNENPSPLRRSLCVQSAARPRPRCAGGYSMIERSCIGWRAHGSWYTLRGFRMSAPLESAWQAAP
jgi:hypothetical protein